MRNCTILPQVTTPAPSCLILDAALPLFSFRVYDRDTSSPSYPTQMKHHTPPQQPDRKKGGRGKFDPDSTSNPLFAASSSKPTSNVHTHYQTVTGTTNGGAKEVKGKQHTYYQVRRGSKIKSTDIVTQERAWID